MYKDCLKLQKLGTLKKAGEAGGEDTIGTLKRAGEAGGEDNYELPIMNLLVYSSLHS